MDKRYIAKVIMALCTINVATFPIIAVQFIELEYFVVILVGALVVHIFVMYIVYQIINNLGK